MSNTYKSFILVNQNERNDDLFKSAIWVDKPNDDLFNSAVFVDKPTQNMAQGTYHFITRNVNYVRDNMPTMPTIGSTKTWVAGKIANKLVDAYADQAINSSVDFLSRFSTKSAVKIFLVNKVAPFGLKSAAGKFSDEFVEKIIANTGDPLGKAIRQFITNDSIKQNLKRVVAHEISGEGYAANLYDFMNAPVAHIPTILDDTSNRMAGKVKDINAIKIAYAKALMWREAIKALQAEIVGELGGALVHNAPSFAQNSAVGRMFVGVLPTIISDGLGTYLKTMGGQYTDIDTQIRNAEIMIERNNIIKPSYSENISEVKSTGFGFAMLDRDYGKLTHIREAGVALNKKLFAIDLAIMNIYENLLDEDNAKYTPEFKNNAIAKIEALEADMKTARSRYREDIQSYIAVENIKRRDVLLGEIKAANDKTHNNAKLSAESVKSKIQNLPSPKQNMTNSDTLPKTEQQVDNSHGYLGWMMNGMQFAASQAYNTAVKTGNAISSLTTKLKVPNIFLI